MNIKVLSATSLKIIAIILMFGDHVHQMFAGSPVGLTILGRAVFPIFLFCVAESFHYTRSKGRLILRLGIAAVLMAMGSIFLMQILPNESIFLFNSAFSCFFITAIYMKVWDMLRAKKWLGGGLLAILPIVLAMPAVVFFDNEWVFNRICLLVPSLLTLTDGGWFMVALGVLFYVLRCHRVRQIIILLAFAAISGFYYGNPFQPFMALGALPIIMYNGLKGRGLKWLFYGFYPVHIWILYIIATIY